jgi:signal transduction histidine kinase
MSDPERSALEARGALLERRDIGRLLLGVLSTLSVAAVAAVAVSLRFHDEIALGAALATLLTAPLLAWLVLRRREALAALGTALLLLAVAIYCVVQGEGLFDVGMLLFPGVIVISGLLLEQRYATAMSVLAVCCAVAVGLAHQTGWIVTSMGHTAYLRDVFNVAILLTAVAAFVHIMTSTLYRGLHRAYQTEQRIRETEQLRAIGQLPGGIAHDFNNQLTGIMASASMLEHEVGHDPKLTGHVQMILRCSTRSADLTRELLAFARRGKALHRAIDCHVLIDEVVALLSRSIDKRIVIEQRLAGVPLHTLGDPSLLQNALLNLALNARDAMPQGGHLCITTRSMRVAPGLRPVEVPPQLPPGEYVQLSISDTGEGMDADTQAKIFEPFFTTKPKGHGMGLAAVYGTMQSHSGLVTVDSTLGVGTTFHLFLPRITPSETDRDSGITALARPGSSELAGLRILVADDEPDVAEVIAHTLEQLGAKVDVCADGRSALHKLTEFPTAFDLVILDQMMPEFTGAQVLSQIREQKLSVPVLITSGFTGDEEHAVFASANEFLRKPFMDADLRLTVRRLLKAKLRRAKA